MKLIEISNIAGQMQGRSPGQRKALTFVVCAREPEKSVGTEARSLTMTCVMVDIDGKHG